MNDETRGTVAPIETMYRAGTKHIPDVATKVSGAVQSLWLACADIDVQTALAGDPRGMRDTLQVCEELHGALRSLTASLNNCAAAVVAAADDFVATDEQAARDFRRMDARWRNAESVPAFEVAPIDDLSAPGATRVSEGPDHSPGKTHQTHVDSTPGPQHLPTVAENRDERDARIETIEVPHEVTR